MTIDGWVCLYKWLFTYPVKLWRWTTGPVEPLNGIINDMSGAKLLSMTQMDCLSLSCRLCPFLSHNWRHSTAACVLMKGMACHWLPTFPPKPICPSSFMLHSWLYSGYDEAGQNPTVWATIPSRNRYKMLAKRLL